MMRMRRVSNDRLRRARQAAAREVAESDVAFDPDDRLDWEELWTRLTGTVLQPFALQLEVADATYVGAYFKASKSACDPGWHSDARLQQAQIRRGQHEHHREMGVIGHGSETVHITREDGLLSSQRRITRRGEPWSIGENVTVAHSSIEFTGTRTIDLSEGES
jgi:hypothetical protein